MLQGINEKLQKANSKADEANNLDNKQDSDAKVSMRFQITSMLSHVITRLTNKIFTPE